MDLTINAVTETWIKDTSSPKFWTTCPFCSVCYRLHRSFVSKQTRCRCCNKDFTARETPLQGLSSKDSTPKRILSQMLRETHQYHPVAPSSSGPSFWTTCRNCGCRHRFLRVYLDKWFVCPSCKEETIAMEVLSSSGEVRFSKWFQEFRSMCKNEAASVSGNKSSPGEKRKREEEVAALSQNHSKPDGVIGSGVDNNRRGFNGNGDEASSSGNAKVDNNFCLRDSSSGGGVQPKIAGLKFNDFGKLREEVNFAVGQVWALYDTTDKVPRQYALIRKVSVPSFGLRITYLEPDPDDEEEIQWFEEDLPVCTGQFRLGKNENTKDRSLFSHVIHCNEGGSNSGHFTVSPRKGETWALFKNWDINWSSEPDSHRSYEYEFVEILSDYTDGAGVYAAILHKAKGFASVFFPMGTGDADKFYILPHSLYRFYHRIPSFKLTGVDVKGLPKYAYELDQAALPATIEEVTVPSHLLAEFAPPKPEALCFPEEGIIPWEDKKLHVSCGTFLVSKVFAALAPNNFSHLMVPQASMEGNEYTYTILPKVGQVWAIYRFWNGFLEETYEDYVVVEVLDDALDYKVLALEPALQFIEEKEGKRVFGAAESRPRDYDDGDEVMFTIPKLKVLRFSHQIGASRVTKEIDGELKELFELDTAAVLNFLHV